MKRAVIVALGLSGALLAPVTTQADPIGIEVLSTTYSLDLSLNSRTTGVTTTIASAGSDPVSEAVSLDESSDSGVRLINASASADWLAVSVDGLQPQSRYGTAWLTADVELMFSPITDSSSTLDITYSRSGEYGSGLGILFDVTTQQEVWKIYFGSEFGGHDGFPLIVTQGGNFYYAENKGFNGDPSTFGLLTALSADHVYDLHLTAKTANPNFRTYSSLQVSGLLPVPEPSSLFLLGAGLASLGLGRARRGPARHKETAQ